MKSYKYCIIGGGPGGLGVLNRLLKEGETDVILFEGRGELLYTLSFMPFVKRTSKMFPEEVTGVQFRDKILKENIHTEFVKLNSRLIGLNKKDSICTVNINGEENLEIGYKTLIIATGAVQSIYGKELLPGFRGAGVFTTYQISEMLTRYDFLPGKNLGIIGDCEYSLETAIIAEKEGIAVTLLSNSSSAGSRGIKYKTILSLEGDEHISGIVIENESGKETFYPVDSLAVDGEFSMEHKMRDLLDLEWNVDSWQAGTENDQSHPDFNNIYLAGDAFKPTFSFLDQYENGYSLAGGLR